MSARRPVRVLCIKDQITEAGGSIYFLRTLPLMDPQRVQVVAMCGLKPRHPMGDRFEAAGIPTQFLGRAKWDPRSLIDIRRQIQIHDPDVVHMEGRKTLLFGRLAARQLGRPAINHFHDMLPLSGPMRPLQRRLAPWTTRALAVSKAVRDFVIENFDIAAERVDVLHNGLDIDRFRSADADARMRVRRELDIDDARPLIGVVGRIVAAIKGQDIMLQVMTEVLQPCPDAVLALVGDGPDLESCRALAADLGIERSIRFMGRRDDMPDVLAAIDVVAVPSVCDEGFPFAALEALAAGRPVVAFRSGGVPEIVQDQVTGIVVTMGDEAGLAAGLVRLLEDRDLYDRMVAHGREHAQDFAIGSHVSKLTAIYEEVTAAHRAGLKSRTVAR